MIGQVHHHAPPRRAAAWPHQVGAVPPQAAHFQDREESAELTAALAGGGTAVLGQAGRVTVVGLGGVGKSQLAAHYARGAMRSGEVDVLVWTTATTRSAVIDTYARAAAELIGPAAPEDPEHAAAAFTAWLEDNAGRPGCRWLVVLDDLADPDDLTGLWPPASPTGRTLVTTRRQDPALLTGRRLVSVGVFSPDEARAYLTDVLDRHPAGELDALAADLGCLPLALAQAAAYIAELADTGMTPAAYRSLLADRTTALRDAAPDRLPDGQALTVAATWSLSIEHADTMRPVGLARPMLHLASFLDPNGIPDAVLTGGPALGYLARCQGGGAAEERRGLPARFRRRSRTPSATEAEARTALSALRRLSLVEHSPDRPATAVRVHQLVQRAVRDTLADEQRDRLARTAADAVLAAWPDIERDTALVAALRANTTALSACAGEALYRPDAHSVLYLAGDSLGEAGQVAAARAHFDLLTGATTHFLGPDHPDTLSARQHLAHWQGETGNAAGAVTALAELLQDHLRVLGPDHRHALSTRSHLAHWQGEAGDATGAVTTYTELMPDLLRVLGPDHPETLAARSNLARWRGDAGDATGAATAYTELLRESLRVLGPDHPDTLTARSNLASCLGDTGDATGAATAYAELLQDRLRILGPDHPATLHTRNNLAHWQGKAGDAADAVTTYTELMPDLLRVLGPDHPTTLSARGNLAIYLGDAGDTAGAVTAHAELLEDRLRVLGPDHPDTLATRINLAGYLGDAAGAVSACTELLQDCLRVLGPDHPDTLLARNNLAYWRGEAGDVTGTVTAYIELLRDRSRVLGPDHPDTLTTWYDLAYWRREAGDVTGTVAAYTELLEGRSRVLGPDHPDTLATRGALAQSRGEAGDVAGAVTAFAELLEDRLRVLGPDHPATLRTRHNLAHWCGEAGDAAGAATAFAGLLPDLLRVLGPDHPDTVTARDNLAGWQALAEEAAGGG